jgi:L-cysteine:1D-myo-inositol 2-amino-2-deoxy-alpha-D-glucopyranoside ligase
MAGSPVDAAVTAEQAPILSLGGSALPLAGRARIYACGITPYDVTHLGHASTFVW